MTNEIDAMLSVLKRRGLDGMDAVTCLSALQRKTYPEGGIQRAVSKRVLNGGVNFEEVQATYGQDAARAMLILISEEVEKL